jgi:hypothetical protein
VGNYNIGDIGNNRPPKSKYEAHPSWFFNTNTNSNDTVNPLSSKGPNSYFLNNEYKYLTVFNRYP